MNSEQPETILEQKRSIIFSTEIREGDQKLISLDPRRHCYGYFAVFIEYTALYGGI